MKRKPILGSIAAAIAQVSAGIAVAQVDENGTLQPANPPTMTGVNCKTSFGMGGSSGGGTAQRVSEQAQIGEDYGASAPDNPAAVSMRITSRTGANVEATNQAATVYASG